MAKKASFIQLRRRDRLGAFALFTVLASPLAGFAEPFVPASDDQVLERLPISAEPFNKELRDLRAALDGAPENLDLAVKLAQIYVKIGKLESDPRYYGYAQGVLQPWWKAQEPPINVLLLRALIRQNRHDFDGALQDLAQILAKEPGNIQAWLTRAVILKVRAQYDQARRSCLPLMESKDPLLAVTCLSDVNSLLGRARDSYNFLLEFMRGHKPTSEEQHLWSSDGSGGDRGQDRSERGGRAVFQGGSDDAAPKRLSACRLRRLSIGSRAPSGSRGLAGR